MKKILLTFSAVFVLFFMGQKIDAKTEEISTRAASAVISNEAELTSALTSASGDTVLTIEAGTTINLTKELAINTDKVSNITFESTGSDYAVLKNASAKKHINVTGSKALVLNFTKVKISSEATTLNGGIKYTNKGLGNEINNLYLENNYVTGWQNGIIDYQVASGDLTINDSNIINNHATVRNAVGSGIIYFDGNNSNLSVNNSLFDGNEIKNQQGAVIAVYNVNGSTTLENIKITNTVAVDAMTAGLKYNGSSASSLNINNSTFDNNNSDISRAGAMYLTLKGTTNTNITNTDITNNFGYRGGGGIYVDATTTSGNLKIDNVKLNGNKSSLIEYDPSSGTSTGLPSNGGAIYIYQASGSLNLDISNSEITNNEAGSAGAIYLWGSMIKTNIDKTKINNNLADYQGGAIATNHTNDTQDKGLYNITNSEFLNNTVTGKDTGPSYHHGGHGGAIYHSDLIEAPNTLTLDGVTFDNNKSPYQVAWNHNGTTGTLNKIYTDNILNTTYSDPAIASIPTYNNAFNGDDIYVESNSTVEFKVNQTDISSGLDKDLKYATYKTDHILEPEQPKSDNYKFLGWYDAADKKWNFDTDVQTVNNLVLTAKWEKIVTYTVTFDLNEASKDENNDILEQETVAQNGKATNPGIPAWADKADFDGWYLLDESGKLSQEWDFNTVVTKDMTLYAKWKVNVNFMVDGKESIDYPMITLDRKDTLNLSNGLAKAATITEWYIDEALTTKFDTSKPILEHTTLYATTKVEDNKETTDPKDTTKDEQDVTSEDDSTTSDVPKTGSNILLLALGLISIAGIGTGIYRKFN